MSKRKVMEVCSAAIQPAGIILLVTGAGGVFKQVLVDSGVGPALGNALIGAGMPIAVAFLFLQVLYVLFRLCDCGLFNCGWFSVTGDQ